jgi:hypothetical protein
MDVNFHKHCILKSWMAAGMDMPEKFGANDATEVTCWGCDLFFCEWKMT